MMFANFNLLGVKNLYLDFFVRNNHEKLTNYAPYIIKISFSMTDWLFCLQQISNPELQNLICI